jgi:hypothetical protein
MKRLILGLAFVVITCTAFSQERWRGFFEPVDKSIFIPTQLFPVRADGTAANVWLFRPVVALSALQFMFTSPVEVSSFSSLGTGLSFQHLISNGGEPYTNYGFNALILFTNKIGDVAPASLSFAVTGSFLNYVSLGAGYSLQAKKVFILTGVTYSFNN